MMQEYDDRRDDVELRGMTDRPGRHDEVEEDKTGHDARDVPLRTRRRMKTMTRDEAIDILKSACESELNTLWNFDSHIKYHRKEGENVIAAFKELFDVELDSPWD